MATTSTRSAFDHQLDSIRDSLIRMGSLVDYAIDQANIAFQQHDPAQAHEIIKGDIAINDLRYKVEQDVNACMALQQPMAHDLRRLLSSFVIANELERMGDYAEGIARTVLRYPQESAGSIPPEVSDMGNYVRQMLRDAMDAFVTEDTEKARATAQMDDRVDSLYRQMFKHVVEQMAAAVIPAERGTYLMWAGHNLERMGDRVTNICERTIFSKTGITAYDMNPKSDHKEPPV
jgi:phosphate transport system protein